MKNIHPLILSILTGLLLAISWPNIGNLTPIIFIAFLPILTLAEVRINKNNFGYYFLSFTIFNGISGFWVCYASLWGGIAAAMINGIVMALVFQAFSYAKNNLTNKLANLTLIFAWLGFEYFHNNWDLSWSWFNLGNVFASNIKWIQWYEYIGVQGGTLWILLINIFIFQTIKLKGEGITWYNISSKIVGIVLLLVLPILCSYYIFNNYKEKGAEAKFVVVQPNFEAYSEKFTLPEQTQASIMSDLALQKIDSATSFVLFPETSIARGFWLHETDNNHTVQVYKSILDKYPKLSILTGASLYELYPKDVKPTATARKIENSYYDSYNSAIHLHKNKANEFYHKSKLVPGVEKLPFPAFFGFLENITINIGGESGSLGIQQKPTVFVNNEVKIAPAICYESIYGEHINGFVNAGANVIAIITNDGWWQDTPGYKQHWQYAKLRAIETRRSIARSANTGISGFINQKGEVIQSSKWDERTVMSQNLILNNKITFYTQHGDYLYRLASFMAIALLLFAFVKSKKKLV